MSLCDLGLIVFGPWSFSLIFFPDRHRRWSTIDLVSFPNPSNPKDHPLFWAVDINNELTENATICSFFDILMEGQLDQETGEYNIEVMKDNEDMGDKPTDEILNNISSRVTTEPRNFMYCSFLHHPGLSTI